MRKQGVSTWEKKRGIFMPPHQGCTAHIWYEGISHQYASAGTKVKVICKGQGQI